MLVVTWSNHGKASLYYYLETDACILGTPHDRLKGLCYPTTTYKFIN